MKFFEFTQYHQINTSIHIKLKLFAVHFYIFNFSITNMHYLIIKIFNKENEMEKYQYCSINL